jgi:hypothetical protein
MVPENAITHDDDPRSERRLPDARFVMTHRDITSVIPSVCAVKEALSTPLTDSFDCLALGQHEHMLWLESIRRLIEFRNDGREDRLLTSPPEICNAIQSAAWSNSTISSMMTSPPILGSGWWSGGRRAPRIVGKGHGRTRRSTD